MRLPFTKPNGKKDVKSSAAGGLLALTTLGRAKWTGRRYDTQIEEGYRKNVVAWRCVTMVADAVAHIPYVLYDAKGKTPDAHPVQKLLARPNPTMSGADFLAAIATTWLLAGNVYIEAVRPDEGDATELYLLRPDRMKVLPGPAGLPLGYEYSVAGKTHAWRANALTGACDILHLKTFNPLDDWYGMAPLEAALMSVDQHNAAGTWNQALLNQAARPSGALVYAPRFPCRPQPIS